MRHTTKLIFSLLFFPCIALNSINNIMGQESGLTIDNKDLSFKSDLKCVTKEKMNPESKDDPIIIKTCVWRNYKVVTTGHPDYNGVYSYNNEIFLVDKGQSKKINNSDLFNDKLKQLEKLINEKLKNEFDAAVKDTLYKDCLADVTYNNFEINKMGITFNDNNKMEFTISLGLSSACLCIDGFSVSFELKDIGEYLK